MILEESEEAEKADSLGAKNFFRSFLLSFNSRFGKIFYYYPPLFYMPQKSGIWPVDSVQIIA